MISFFNSKNQSWERKGRGQKGNNIKRGLPLESLKEVPNVRFFISPCLDHVEIVKIAFFSHEERESTFPDQHPSQKEEEGSKSNAITRGPSTFGSLWGSYIAKLKAYEAPFAIGYQKNWLENGIKLNKKPDSFSVMIVTTTRWPHHWCPTLVVSFAPSTPADLRPEIYTFLSIVKRLLNAHWYPVKITTHQQRVKGKGRKIESREERWKSLETSQSKRIKRRSKQKKNEGNIKTMVSDKSQIGPVLKTAKRLDGQNGQQGG